MLFLGIVAFQMGGIGFDGGKGGGGGAFKKICWMGGALPPYPLPLWKSLSHVAGFYGFVPSTRYTAIKLAFMALSTFVPVIVGKGAHTPPPFSVIPPFLEIHNVFLFLTFYRPIGKTEVLNDCFN